jgi:glycerol-3-phosphate dehydrogenase subunit B
MRIRDSFVNRLHERGVTGLYHNKVTAARVLPDGRIRVSVGGQDPIREFTGRAVILATGRFFGRGLHADRHRIRETVFDLPVHQPPDRNLWYEKEYFAPCGHGINRAGVDTDDRFRPLGPDGKPLLENLFAAGSILAHQDWKRQKCGSGLAVTTAYAAVRAALDSAGPTRS